MIFTKLHIHKLLFIALVICYLNSFIDASKLPKSQTNANDAEIATSAEVTSTIEISTPINKIQNKSSEEEEADDDEEIVDDSADEKNEKTALQPTADTSLSVWNIVSGLWNWIREDISESLFGDSAKTSDVGEGRTFGKIRRLQMALIPIVFKFGVLSAMVAFLVGIGLKTLFLVKILVLMNLLALLAKFFTLKTNYGYVEHVAAPPAPVWNWNPHVTSGWPSTPVEHHSNKEIHLHIHGGQTQPQVTSYSYGSGGADHSHGWERSSDPYKTYETMTLEGEQNQLPNELINGGGSMVSGQQLNENFPTNHRMH